MFYVNHRFLYTNYFVLYFSNSLRIKIYPDGGKTKLYNPYFEKIEVFTEYLFKFNFQIDNFVSFNLIFIYFILLNMKKFNLLKFERKDLILVYFDKLHIY